MIDADLASFLIAAAPLDSSIGNRVYPNKVPPAGEYLPAVTYYRVSTEYLKDMGGSAGLARARFQVNCWAERYKPAKELAAAVRGLLDDYVGTMGGTVIDRIFCVEEADILDPKLGIDADVPYGVRQDYMIHYRGD